MSISYNLRAIGNFQLENLKTDATASMQFLAERQIRRSGKIKADQGRSLSKQERIRYIDELYAKSVNSDQWISIGPWYVVIGDFFGGSTTERPLGSLLTGFSDTEIHATYGNVRIISNSSASKNIDSIHYAIENLDSLFNVTSPSVVSKALDAGLTDLSQMRTHIRQFFFEINSLFERLSHIPDECCIEYLS